MFKTYDVNKTGVLTEKELNSVFAPIEDAMPLWTQLRKEHHVLCVQWFLLIHSMNPTCPQNCYSNENNDLTLTGWVSEWILMLHIAPDLTLQTLVFLGYSDDISLLFTVTQPRQVDWEKRNMLRRNVAHAFMFGDKGVGKVSGGRGHDV